MLPDSNLSVNGMILRFQNVTFASLLNNGLKLYVCMITINRVKVVISVLN